MHQEGGLHSLLALLVWPFLVISHLWEKLLLPLRLSLGDQVRDRGASSDPQLSSSLQSVKKVKMTGYILQCCPVQLYLTHQSEAV